MQRFFYVTDQFLNPDQSLLRILLDGRLSRPLTQLLVKILRVGNIELMISEWKVFLKKKFA